jgi:hypothetical protein
LEETNAKPEKKEEQEEPFEDDKVPTPMATPRSKPLGGKFIHQLSNASRHASGGRRGLVGAGQRSWALLVALLRAKQDKETIATLRRSQVSHLSSS